MILKTIATGSSGNAYALINDNDEILLLDLGVSAKEIKKAIDFKISDVVGCIVSHEHLDHSRSADDFLFMGIPVFKPYESLSTNQLIQDEFYGEFRITAFPLPHNGVKNYGFVIMADGQRILYMTDFEYCKYIFRANPMNHIIIECNYQTQLINKDLPNYEHKIKGHCSLDTCKKFIEANRTEHLKTVILCHLGGDTANPDECKAEIEKAAQCPVYVATKGLEVELWRGE